MKKKRIIYILCIIILLGLIAFAYSKFISPTRIAVLNFPDFTVEKFIRSNNNSFVKIKRIKLEDADRITGYDMVLVRVHGTTMDATHLEAIKKAIEKGVAVFSTESDNEEINSLHSRELEYVNTLIENGSVKNYRSLFNYIRARIDKKLLFNKKINEPVIIPQDYYFHLGEDEFFSTFYEYQAYYEKSGKYKKDAPRVVLLSGNINMQNSNEEHMAAIINSLEKRGLNVYPISSFGVKKLEMIQAVKPNLIINRPHGRLVMGGGEVATDMLKTLNVPILAPVTVSEPYDKWLKGKQGMISGGMTSMSVVMPELDGAIAPMAIAAQFEKDGMQIFDAIPTQTEKFCSTVQRFLNLQTKENKDKKVVIYYYKGIGKGTVSASGIEGVQSLYNTLVLLKKSGYNVSNLPPDTKSLEKMIQTQGSVLGTYAVGAYDEFIKHGNPALVEVATFDKWIKAAFPKQLVDDMEARYGKAPGEYMGVEKDGKTYIAVARIQFGNVVIMPQPLPSVGDDIDKLIHGAEGAPAYPYVASYLWARNGFKTDALIHFGTHGSLEFIPGKQFALSNYDWTDALVGDLPHFYIYTISNIGEGIIAKRRSYATLISHLTAPFMQSELYSSLKMLKDKILKAKQMEESDIKQNYRENITELAKTQNILSALSIDTKRTVTDKDIERIHLYLEEIDGAKVSDGLYTLGEPYSAENIKNTTRLMSIDPVRYSLAMLDAAHGLIDDNKLDDLTFMANRYSAKANNIIAMLLQGKGIDYVLNSLVSKADATLLDSYIKAEQENVATMQSMMQMMGSDKPKTLAPFFDKDGNLIDAERRIADMTSSEKMALAKTLMKDDAQAQKLSGLDKMRYSKKDDVLLNALKTLKSSLENVEKNKVNLQNSTSDEQKSLLNALSGGYIAPGSAGDPIVNPKAVPTGKNFYSINPEATPSPEAWKVGKHLAENLLEAELNSKGKYPEKISFTLWSTDFISSEGATVAQILYLLGVEPLRDGFGYIRSLKLIPAKDLGRPRIDVVVQTSGQLRDIAASRLKLISQAVIMAAASKDKDNYVRKGVEDAERSLLAKGFSPADARKYAGERIFGGVNGNFGTGIMGMVEKGDSWDSNSQIAKQYIKNMGALYSSNGDEDWAKMYDGVFEAALLNTSVVVQPRSSNTWGALSLDHVYEFMGGMSAAVKQVTGNDPSGYFNDFRNSSRAKVQELKEAIGVESNSTILNPKYISEMMKGEQSAMNTFAETIRNTYGWNALKPSAIDQHIWNKYYDVYVKDEYNLGIEKTFSQKNPYAMQELTAVMLESARKGMWQASEVQLKALAKLHTKFVTEHGAGCSGFICDNGKLKEFIASKVEKAEGENYKKSILAAREVQIEQADGQKNVVLKKEQTEVENAETKSKSSNTFIYIIAGLLLSMLVLVVVRSKASK